VRRERPEQTVSAYLEPGETVLWSGRPDTDAALAQFAPWKVRGLIVVLGGVGGVAFLLRGTLDLGSVADVVALLRSEPQFLVPIAVVAFAPVLARVLKFDNASRLRRHFDSLTYAMTDRRLIIVEKGEAQSFGIEDLAKLRVRERGPGCGDVVFGDGRTMSSGGGRGDVIARERWRTGFKGLPDAESVLRRVEAWKESQLGRAEESVAEFTASIEEASGWGPGEGIRRVENRRVGLTLDTPETWTAEVRHKKKPFGKTFVDSAKWRPLTGASDWNVLRVSGPAGAAVEVEVFETEPTVTFDAIAHSKLAETFGGKAIASDPAVDINGVQGFSVTRRNDAVIRGDSGRAQAVDLVMPERRVVLHDGRRQACILAHWPEDSAELAEAVDLIVRSFRFG
jgi:hypothetical protein